MVAETIALFFKEGGGKNAGYYLPYKRGGMITYSPNLIYIFTFYRVEIFGK